MSIKIEGGGAAENVIKAGTSNQLLYNDKEVILKENFLNLVYPVGSIYLSSKNTNPGTLFGGTWTQIKDKFILTAGDSYSNGATGGAATVTLTVSNMPSHSHSFTPSGTVSSHSHSFTPSGTVGSHTHSFTPSGTVSSHTHSLNSGNTSTSGTTKTAGFRCVNTETTGTGKHSHEVTMSAFSFGVGSNGSAMQAVDESGSAHVKFNFSKGNSTTETGDHTHTVSVVGYLYGNTDTATPSFTGTAGTTAATTPSFTGTAGTTSATTPSFTGTAGNTSSSGSGSSFSILPPYVVKYCWERTA